MANNEKYRLKLFVNDNLYTCFKGALETNERSGNG